MMETSHTVPRGRSQSLEGPSFGESLLIPEQATSHGRARWLQHFSPSHRQVCDDALYSPAYDSRSV